MSDDCVHDNLAVRIRFLSTWITIFAGFISVSALADEPLHEVIDRLIAAKVPAYAEVVAPLAGDDEFLRRVTLDLTGTIPTPEEARRFCDDPDPDKRSRLIDQLLGGPQYARHMQRVFDLLLMRRLPEMNVPTAQWQTYLRQSFAENKPWDQITREILGADGVDPDHCGPARFYLDRQGDADVITRDLGRIFLGADLECAQCHHHPEIDDWKQEDYYGLSAFIVRSFVFTDKDEKKSFAEKAEGDVEFISAFDVRDKKSQETKSTPPRVFGGPPIEEPKFEKGQEYEVAPADNVRPIPKFSRRDQLAESIIGTEHNRFARTAANRLWAMMMGRGLIHPVDHDHAGNPPSHPELLNRLGQEFATQKFDIQWLLREIALSRTYQLSSRHTASDLPTVALKDKSFARAILKPLSPAQLARAMLEATGEADVQRAALGDQLTEKTLDENLFKYEEEFVNRFGGPPGKPPEQFESTISQILFLSNHETMQNLIASKEGNLTDRLLRFTEEESAATADELFFSILSRLPTEQDVQDVSECLAGQTGKPRTAAIEALIWALITSPEFRFNH